MKCTKKQTHSKGTKKKKHCRYFEREIEEKSNEKKKRKHIKRNVTLSRAP